MAYRQANGFTTGGFPAGQGYQRQPNHDRPQQDGPRRGPSRVYMQQPGFGGAGATEPARRQTVRGATRGTIRDTRTGTIYGGSAQQHQQQQPQRELTRRKTLIRPDRYVAPAPLINPNGVPVPTTTTATPLTGPAANRSSKWDPWGIFVSIVTFWAPSWLLSRCGLRDPVKQRAWKEKCTLCAIALCLGGFIGFITIGMNRVLCPTDGDQSPSAFVRLGTTEGFVGIMGWDFNVSDASSNWHTLAQQQSGQDVSNRFDRSGMTFGACDGLSAAYATSSLCGNSSSSTMCTISSEPTATVLDGLALVNSSHQVGYDWEQVANKTNYIVLDGAVLNLEPYFAANPEAIDGDEVDAMLRRIIDEDRVDATRYFYHTAATRDAVDCLQARYRAGKIDRMTPGCFISQLVLYSSLILIMSIILARFVMALVFKWCMSHRLIRAPRNLKRQVISPAVLPEGANLDVDNLTGAAPWTNQAIKRSQTTRLQKGRKGRQAAAAAAPLSEKELPELGERAYGRDGMISMASIGAESFTCCLVTCYSEGADGIRATLDSISATEYSDARKLLFVVCDGMITGSGERMSTPDVCVSLIERDQRFGEPLAMSYVAVAEGDKAHNQALVYAGHYTNVRGHRTPTIVVVKCGPPSEAKEKKPGNRGKRDSQMILMNFFSRVTYNDRMTPLDFDLFRKIQSLMGVTPDFFETVLMVDADTKVYPPALGNMVRCMQNDHMIMGVCGETRIENKRQSWVTMIQVFEYFISHHLIKAFESSFGGVTCLPGCFSMYRLKARKPNDSDWVPVLTSPIIIQEYSQSTVTTLHQKNLLLLGEDRFLTTLMLRTFPNRKMMFLPQARCRTVAPDTFKVLLSQRRRWINSTVHNLMELVRVRALCGTFCFSMQFIVFVDLIGTVVLPVAICLTYTMIINFCINPPASFSDAIPLILLFGVLGLPGVVIVLSTAKIVYVGWMLVYLLALPIWNFVLPAYAFSKFDDFSWGETRKVEGERKGEDGHAAGLGVSAASAVPLRRWEDWERSRLRKIKREEKRRREFERQFGQAHFHHPSLSNLDAMSTFTDTVSPSDSASMFSASGEEDRWGAQIGAYYEDGPSAMPPPVGLYSVDELSDEQEGTYDASEMEAVLESGWADDTLPGSSRESPVPGHHNDWAESSFTLRQGYGSALSITSPPATASMPLKGYSLSDVPLTRAPERDSSSGSSSREDVAGVGPLGASSTTSPLMQAPSPLLSGSQGSSGRSSPRAPPVHMASSVEASPLRRSNGSATSSNERQHAAAAAASGAQPVANAFAQHVRQRSGSASHGLALPLPPPLHDDDARARDPFTSWQHQRR